MLDKVIALKNGDNSVRELADTVRQGVPSAVFGVTDAFKNYLVSTIDAPVLYVVKDGLTAATAERAIREFSGKKTVVIPPKEETLIFARAFSKDGLFKRLSALKEIDSAQVIITTSEALMQTFPKTAGSLTVTRNETLTRESATDYLVSAGYVRAEAVMAKGTFAVRGDVLDVFPIDSEMPVRVDFFDDLVESVKYIDPETRKSVRTENSVVIPQAVEYSFSRDNVKALYSAAEKEYLSADKNRRVRLRELIDELAVAVENGGEGLNILSPLSVDCGTVFDRLKQDTVVVFDEAKRVYDLAVLCEKEFTERFNSLYPDGEVFSFAKNNCIGVDALKEKFSRYRRVALQSVSASIPFFDPLRIINPKVSGVTNYRLDFKEVFSDIDNWLYSGYRVLVCAGDVRRAENFCSDLSEHGFASTLKEDELKGVVVSAEKLSGGFIFHEEKTVVIGTGNLFRSGEKQKKLRARKDAFFTAPEVGDYCVHETHGLGRVLGSKKITSTEGTKDYVSVEYAGGDILYVPVEQMDILTRYLGGEKKPRLSRIGGADFEKVKKAVKESIKKMSFDLKKLYSERRGEGFAFKVDEDLEKAFADAFPFEETPDQITADAEIRSDMQTPRVMDRLICGDVGFGKTEVALRAAFRAVINGKQAAMLAPTTILAEQHFNTATERFKDFGVRIVALDRFRTAKEQREIVEKLKNGDADIVVGTHRLLSKDVGFKDLGLLILDEEQRFGVEHKEKIKLLKKDVDTLTLTATPIPRTLHMSLSGIRSISVINTPPKKRLPVQTFVTEETDALIKDAVLREKSRGGQTFIMYNRVESIFTFAERVKTLLPEVRITVVHGQMEERAMENGITEFYRGASDVLLSTTIIENGIDLPKANTLIVIDADRLGLSTLYQLKGRVGRSDRLAYAYFTYKKDKILSDNAFDRLNAIIEFTEMGSGIKIAMRDLEIRGAGNVLGAEQHGHMDKIGYELYSKLLREELSGKREITPELDVRLSAYIPESYIEGNVARMDAYKEIAEISDEKERGELAERLKDAYGDIPQETENLMDIALIKRLASKVSASKVTVRKGEISLEFAAFSDLNNQKLLGAIEKYSQEVTVSMSGAPKLCFASDGKRNTVMPPLLKEFLSDATANRP